VMANKASAREIHCCACVGCWRSRRLLALASLVVLALASRIGVGSRAHHCGRPGHPAGPRHAEDTVPRVVRRVVVVGGAVDVDLGDEQRRAHEVDDHEVAAEIRLREEHVARHLDGQNHKHGNRHDAKHGVGALVHHPPEAHVLREQGPHHRQERHELHLRPPHELAESVEGVGGGGAKKYCGTTIFFVGKKY
jgi:hypothetical protein